MLLRRLKNISFFSRFYLLGLLFLLNACTDLKKAIIHNYPKQKAFVYENYIKITDAESKKTKKLLTNALANYWDDSLKAKHVRQFGIFNTLVQPIEFQPERMPRSVNYMQGFLNSKGYNHALLSPSYKIDTVKGEWRTYLTMNVLLNKKTIIDTVVYQLNDPLLQNIALKNRDEAYLKKGYTYSNDNINNELDRLVELFRANGFYYFTKEKIFAEVDTLDQSLMQLNLDPLSQVNQIISANKKEAQNPAWKISFQLRNSSPKITKQYPIGKQIFYSDLSLADNPDSVIIKKMSHEDEFKTIVHAYQMPKFKSSLFEQQSFVKKGDLFNERIFYKTLNNFSSLGAWQQIDARTTVVNDSIYLHYLLVPSLRRSVSLDLEGSRNTAQLGAGNLIGFATSLTYRDKNVQKKSIPSITNLRAGVELNFNNAKENLAQTLLWNIGHTYSFPNILIPFVPHRHAANYNTRSNFALNGSSMDRLNYYQLKSFTTNWGYEWKNVTTKGEHVFLYKPLNIELYQLTKYSKLDSLLLLNPFLRSSFNEGNVLSQTFTFLHNGPSKNHPAQSNYIRLGIEDAGSFAALIPSLKENIYTYIKAELELRKAFKFENTELAMRFLGGWGNNYSNVKKLGGQLPFFKQFTAGGPYSMRAWGLRQLGLGSSQFYDTSASSQNFDRFGDLQLEANIEYRYTLFQWGSYKMGSALFMDMGNIWNTRDTKLDPTAGFKLDRLYKDLAIGVGTGIRFDFNYFIVRVDYAIKMKDPTRLNNNGWLDFKNMKWNEVKPNGMKVNNYAWQFGIGLPF
jgi:outer membrane protein insertion porin family